MDEDKIIKLIGELYSLARQYRSDMRHPPADDSRKRRIEWINSVIGEDVRSEVAPQRR